MFKEEECFNSILLCCFVIYDFIVVTSQATKNCRGEDIEEDNETVDDDVDGSRSG